MKSNKFFAVIMVVLFLACDTAFAAKKEEPKPILPTVQELHVQRIQLERLRRYFIYQFMKNEQTEETTQKIVAVVIKLDLEILKTAYIRANRDQFERELQNGEKNAVLTVTEEA